MRQHDQRLLRISRLLPVIGAILVLLGIGVAVGFFWPAFSDEFHSGDVSAGPAVPAPSPDPKSCDAKADEISGKWTIDQARQFCKFQLYWLGDDYEGLPLTRITRTHEIPPPDVPQYEEVDQVSFMYGECEHEPGSSCSPPVQVIVEAYCSRPPTIWPKDVQSEIVSDFRGVQALVGNYQVVFWTGDVSITVFDSRVSNSSSEKPASGDSEPVPRQMTAAPNDDPTHTANQLAMVNDAGPQAGDPLPPVTASC